MEMKVSALFDTDADLDAARDAACRGGAEAESISVCRAREQAGFNGKNTLMWTAAGAAAGTVIGLGSLALESFGVVSTAGPLAGLISGAVIGAVIGGFVDSGRTEPPEKWLFTVNTDENGAGSIVRQLRRCGGENVSVD